MKVLMLGWVKYFLENLDKLLVKQIDPIKKAQLFGVIFNRLPKYEEIKTGNKNMSLITGVNELFLALNSGISTYGDPKENRTPIAGMRTRCPNR